MGQTPTRARRWKLSELTKAEARELVAGLINRTTYDPITRQLADISFDCPFIAVVAADLLSRGELSASAFASDAALRREVLSRYGNQLASAGPGQDLAERRAVLRALAAYQPVRLNDPAMADAMTQLSKIDDWDEVYGRVRELKISVLPCGAATRFASCPTCSVTSCSRRLPTTTGAARRPLSSAGRTKRLRGQRCSTSSSTRHGWTGNSVMALRPASTSLASCGRRSRDESLAADYDEQVSLLKLVGRIAFFQPAQALELVRAVLDLDVEDTAPAPDGGWKWQATRRDVIHGLAPVLKAVGYHLDHLPEALHLLWSLAQDDDRPTNQFPDHPMRVLVEMADLRTGKPFDYLFAIIDAAESWLSEPSKLSPFNVLEPMLAVEASEHINSGLTLTFRSYGLSPDSVRVVRSRVIDLAIDQAKTADVVTAVRAVNALEAAIRGPHGMFDRKPSETEVDDWAEEFVPTIVELGNIGADETRDPAVRIAVRRALSWHADHGRKVTKTAASQAIARLHRSFIDDVALCLHDGWGRLGLRAAGDYQKAEEARQAEFRRVATELANGRSATDVLKLLEVRLGIERAALDGISSAGRFLWDVFTAAPSVAIALLDTADIKRVPGIAGLRKHRGRGTRRTGERGCHSSRTAPVRFRRPRVEAECRARVVVEPRSPAGFAAG